MFGKDEHPLETAAQVFIIICIVVIAFALIGLYTVGTWIF